MCKINMIVDEELEELDAHECRVIVGSDGEKHRILFLFNEGDIYCDDVHNVKQADGDQEKEHYQTIAYEALLEHARSDDKEEIYRKFWENMTLYTGKAMKDAIDEVIDLNKMLDIPTKVKHFRVPAPEGFENWLQWAKSGVDTEATELVDNLITTLGDDWQKKVGFANVLKDCQHPVYTAASSKAQENFNN